MPIELKMPALSPTMEEGTLAKWLVKEGDTVKSGDLLAEIETDKATMEFEAVDEGTIAKLVVAEGTEGVKVGSVIALIQGEDEDAAPKATPKAEAAPKEEPKPAPAPKAEAPAPKAEASAKPAAPAAMPAASGDRVKASPLARRLAQAQGVDLAQVSGTGPGGRVVKADLDGAP
ncbi:biotin/lipoyl-containing protein, partial [Rhizorhabdus histidinilytica]